MDSWGSALRDLNRKMVNQERLKTFLKENGATHGSYQLFTRKIAIGEELENALNFAFPHSLKMLTLYGTGLLWEDMRMIGLLPHLQVLKLGYNSFCGPEWNPVEGEFLGLKFLLIERCHDLEYWNSNRTHFPCVEQLVLVFLDNLEEIPLDIGHIPTLRSIELLLCSKSAIMSARNLLEEQVAVGNEDLEVRVDGKLQFSSGSL